MDRWIVVVDDEVMSLTNAKNMLGEENMRVSCLRSGAELLKFIKKNSPDLVLLDILMPDMDGFETYHALRELEEKESKPHIPVIFLTGENDSAVEQKGLELGASDFIHKPFSKEVIVMRIENTIMNKKTIESLTEEATFDSLTGLLNKTRGTERISKQCVRKKGALMIMDIDNFKLVNDLFGHEMGDRVLRSFSSIIRNNIRETDTISRIGGDEFLAFYEDLNVESSVASLALRLNTQLSSMASTLMGDDHGIPLGISIGVVMVPDEGREYDKLFALADNALYQVKQNGKHGYRIYSRTPYDDDTENMDDEERLERIIHIVEERNEGKGALLLGNDSFAQIYRFVMRFYKRYGGTASLVMFTLSSDRDTDNLELTEASVQFSSLLQNSLRMSDIIMQSGSDSFIVLLTERIRAESESAVDRILSNWKKENMGDISVIPTYKYIEYSGE